MKNYLFEWKHGATIGEAKISADTVSGGSSAVKKMLIQKHGWFEKDIRILSVRFATEKLNEKSSLCVPSGGGSNQGSLQQNPKEPELGDNDRPH